MAISLPPTGTHRLLELVSPYVPDAFKSALLSPGRAIQTDDSSAGSMTLTCRKSLPFVIGARRQVWNLPLWNACR
ncbi:MAG TPA: hypothetical protein VMA35_01660 [Candidatus Sulfopaludibacter sp.]|nr:hypothetical protein [Candidatus Sulfopaludibacter sp.]